MSQPSTPKEKILITLFALVFALAFTAGGVMGGLLPLYKQLSGWWLAQSYIPVSASVVSAELETVQGKKTQTYRARATFQYEYQGQSYTSYRVNFFDSGSDNIGSYQEDTYRQLSRARDNASPVTVWLDPEHPEQAVYDRTIRWMKMVFWIPFATLFPAVGLGAWWVIWRVWRKKSPQDPFAIALEGSQPTPSPCNPLMIEGDGGGLSGIVTFGAFWNLLSWPSTILFLTEDKVSPWWVTALVLLFPVVGVGFIVKAWQIWRVQRRIGKPRLVLYEQGVLGMKPLQGEIIFTPAFAMRMDTADMTYAVNLNLECIRENSRGETTLRNQLWHGEIAQTQLARGAQSLKFKFDLPDDVPVIAQDSSSSIQEYWQFVLTTLGGTVKFKVPVSVVGAVKFQ